MVHPSTLQFFSQDEMIYIKAGTLDDSQSFKSQFHVWYDSKQDWVELAGNLPQIANQS